MADYLLASALLAAIAAAALAVVRTFAGRATSGRRRALVAIAVAIVATSALLYALMGSRDVQIAGRVVRHGETARPVVALTFDDGPTPGPAADVLGVLAERHVTATFFVIGREAAADMASVRAMVAAGHQVGNHTWSHPRLVFLPSDRVAEEIESTDKVIRSAGFTGPILVRTPFCKRLLTTPLYLAAHDRTNVLWDSEPESEPGVDGDTDAIVERVLSEVKPGSIVLLHPMYPSRVATRRALPRIIDGLRARGYRFVTVNELMALSRD